jgi:hypothetical protein
MSAVPVAPYLEDLTPGSVQTPLIPSLNKSRGLDKAMDSTAAIETAYARGLEDGRARAAADCEARISAHAEAFERRLMEERRRWVADEGERLSELFVSGLGDLEVRVADTMARILKPLLIAEVHRRAVAELAEALDGLLAKGDLLSVTVTGPSDLLEALRTHLQGTFDSVHYVTAESLDVRIVAGETILETCIGAWVRAIEGPRHER